MTSDGVAELKKAIAEVGYEASVGRHYDAMRKLVPVIGSILCDLEEKATAVDCVSVSAVTEGVRMVPVALVPWGTFERALEEMVECGRQVRSLSECRDRILSEVRNG